MTWMRVRTGGIEIKRITKLNEHFEFRMKFFFYSVGRFIKTIPVAFLPLSLSLSPTNLVNENRKIKKKTTFQMNDNMEKLSMVFMIIP